jgi:gamma-glutamyltranspeptidase/glutathione hydrolase
MNDNRPSHLEKSAAVAAVATPHPQAAVAARRVLEQGGNAIDAAVAAVLTLCVVTPSQCGLGGYGGCMVAYLAKRKRMVAIDFDSCAPIQFRRELFEGDVKKKTMEGYLAITVPAVVAGLDLALHKFGTMSFKQVAEHALTLADEGFVLDHTLREQMEEWWGKSDAESRAAYAPHGELPPLGQRWVQKDLANVIRKLRDEGPGALYRGEIPKKIVEHIRAHGGILSEEDFASYRPRVVEPTCVCYRGHELYTPPPPSGGITTFQIIKTLEPFDIAKMDPRGGEFFHTLAEAIKLSWQDRNHFLGDPDFVKIPVEQMLSLESAKKRAEQIRSGRISGSAAPVKDQGPHTVNISAVDKDRNVVSITATMGYLFGSAVAIPGLGLMMAHGMSRFDFDAPDHPNAPAPRKRMQHNMAPVIGMRENRPSFALGLPGGSKIIPITARLIVDAIDFKLSPGESVTMPRIHVETSEPIEVWPNVPEQTVADLERRGHTTKREPKIGGATNVVRIDPSTGTITAADSLGSECVAAI